MLNLKKAPIVLSLLLAISACSDNQPPSSESKSEALSTTKATVETSQKEETQSNPRFDIYKPVTLTADLSHLSDNQKKMVGKLIDASKIMDELFWLQAFGNKNELLNSIDDEKTRRFADINYGPWDRLAGDKPFLDAYSEKPLGAQFYPSDMTKEEFEAAKLKDGNDLYTLVKRNEKGELFTVKYHQAYTKQLTQAADLLNQAAELADNTEFKNYLSLRAKALVTDDFSTQ